MLTSQLGTDEALADRPGVAEAGNGHVRVLHLDDDDSFLELSKRVLESKHDVEVVHETDPEAALGRLPEVDCVVSDYDMPPMNGIEFLETVREEYPDLPFILFTGKGSEEVAGEAISAGVTDYLQKGPDTERFTVLANRITNAVERYRAHKRAEATSERLRRIYERIDDGFVALDEEWQFTYVNQQGAELLDRPPAELLDTTIWDAFPGTIGSRFEEEYRHALEHQETVTFEEYYEPMETWFEVRAFPSESGLSVYFRDVTERKERQLRQEAVFDNTYQFTGLVEPDGTLVEANETALEFVGADREEVVGEPLWETPWFQASDETVAIAHRSVEAARGGEFYRDEFLIEGADGETIFIDYSVRPVHDETGEVALLVPEGRDITERKERERQLREERAFTESLFEAMPDIFYAFDEDGNYLRWNDQFTDVTGYTDGEMDDLEPTELVPEGETELIADAVDEVLYGEGSVTVESELLTADGERLPYEFAAARLEDDDTLAVVGVGRDLSDRRERERRFEAVFNNTFQFTGLLEPDGTLVEVNETALAFGGIERGEAVGKRLCETPWFQTGTEARRAAREAVETARDGEFYRDELPVQGDDRIAVIDFSVKPVFDDRGEVTLLIPEGRDITELKERERQLERKNDQLEEFASIVSHDLKNPLMVASGNVELAVETGQERYLEDAEAALDRMEEMIDDLLELAKQGTAVENPEPVPMSSVYATVEDDTGVDVEVDAPPELAVVADQKRLYSLVCNLVSNAVEHGSTSPPSETLEDAGSEGASEPSVADAPDDAAEHGDDVTVEVGIDGDSLYVADDGVGIPPGDRETVFEPGTSGEDDGTGFGLAIVEAIADAHEWDVSVTESRWGGARFEVSGLDVRSVE
jgi:PAS domain S-box-containing protein